MRNAQSARVWPSNPVVRSGLAMAQAVPPRGIPALVIDTGLRPTPGLATLAGDLGAPYLALPRADARALSAAVDASLSLA